MGVAGSPSKSDFTLLPNSAGDGEGDGGGAGSLVDGSGVRVFGIAPLGATGS